MLLSTQVVAVVFQAVLVAGTPFTLFWSRDQVPQKSEGEERAAGSSDVVTKLYADTIAPTTQYAQSESEDLTEQFPIYSNASTVQNSDEILTTTDAAAETTLVQNTEIIKTNLDATVDNIPVRKNTETTTPAENNTEITSLPFPVNSVNSGEISTQQVTTFAPESEKKIEMLLKNNASKFHQNAGLEYQQQSVSSVIDTLRSALANAEDEKPAEDPAIEQSKLHYITIWNQEADRLNAPYMKVTKAWPEIGMVYMPLVNKLSDQIQNSELVKEAAQKFKVVWEETHSAKDSTSSSNLPILNVLNNFMNAWSWAVGAEDGTDAISAHSASDVNRIDGVLNNLLKYSTLPLESVHSPVFEDNPILEQVGDKKQKYSPAKINIQSTKNFRPVETLKPLPDSSAPGSGIKQTQLNFFRPASIPSPASPSTVHMPTLTDQRPCANNHGPEADHISIDDYSPSRPDTQTEKPINPIVAIRPIIPTHAAPISTEAPVNQRPIFSRPAEGPNDFPRHTALRPFSHHAAIPHPNIQRQNLPGIQRQNLPGIQRQNLPGIQRPVNWHSTLYPFKSIYDDRYSYDSEGDSHSYDSEGDSNSYESFMHDTIPLPFYLLRKR
nr:uncharacterized protein LOC123774510 [Procambarus clarkii]